MSIYLRTEPIIPAWTDYNGHMNLAFYIHLFDQGLLKMVMSVTAGLTSSLVFLYLYLEERLA